jgi:DNA modification methylase
MEPYQTRHRVQIGSARRMAHIRDESVALVVTSPPYPMIEMWDETLASQDAAVAAALAAEDGSAAFEAMHRVLDLVWQECYRVLIPGGFACINIGDAARSIGGRFRLYSNHARILSSCMAAGFDTLPLILWRKQTNAPNKFMGSGMLPAGAYVTLEHEYVLVLRRGERRSLSSPEDRALRQRSALFWEERNRWFSDLWDFKGTRQRLAAGSKRERSGAFPFELASRLIAMYSLQGDVVLDPFLGTGTTVAAAICHGRHSEGIEIDDSLANVADAALAASLPELQAVPAERLEAHVDFVARSAAAGASFRHVNEHYRFPVKTRQEVQLVLPTTTALHRNADGAYTAEHEATALPAGRQLGLF